MQSHFHTHHEAYLALISGEDKGLEYFFNLYYSRMLFHALSITANGFVSEEIVSDSFLKLWESRNKLNDPQQVFALLYRMVTNASIDHMRLQKRILKNKKGLSYYTNNTEPAHMERIIETETFHNLHSLLSKLPPQAGKIFAMHCWHGKDYRQIAEELNISPQTARNQKQRAIQLLKKYASSLSLFITLLSPMLQ